VPDDDWGGSPEFDWEAAVPPAVSETRRRERARRRRQLRRRRLVALFVAILVVGLATAGVISATSSDNGSPSPSSSKSAAAATTATTKAPGVGVRAAATVTTDTPTTTTTTAAKTTTTPAKPVLSPREKELAREDAAIDKLLKRTWFISRGSKKKKQIALTFDDGPGPYTSKVVSVLKRLHAPATFFQVGFMIPEFPAAEKQLIQHGFTIGDHTEQHPNLAGRPVAFQRDQIVTPMEWLKKVGAPKPRLFRAPYGSWDKKTVKLLKRAHMLAVFWTIDTDDWKQPGTKTIIDEVLNQAGAGDIILLHDAGGTRTQTVAALPAIIKGLRKKGYTLVTVPRMIADDPPPHNQKQPIGLEGG
jgi:peptidoglycan/xylan/chitin deacetylase (PgdA/CDA1 family)